MAIIIIDKIALRGLQFENKLKLRTGPVGMRNDARKKISFVTSITLTWTWTFAISCRRLRMTEPDSVVDSHTALT
ncbi:hypothetical protein L484_027036 [Morus notabilis]|uniref:Uncharacterized protein n=1 Tax=Morus notabilis TaxID=981085 RepID=W9RPR5_9ROSA|nr:hypothetical protein L484_027036 [Morus notabilis]